MNIQYSIRFIDMFTNRLLFVRRQSWPEYRAFLPGIPVRIECEMMV